MAVFITIRFVLKSCGVKRDDIIPYESGALEVEYACEGNFNT